MEDPRTMAPEALHEALHEASLDPSRWSAALRALASYVAGDAARAVGALTLAERSGAAWLLVGADAAEREYPLGAPTNHPLFRGAAALPEGFVGPSDRFADAGDLARSTLARAHIADNGTLHGTSAVVASNARLVVSAHVLGRRGAGAWTPDADARLTATLPAVRRAVEVYAALRRARVNARVSDALLDQLDVATFVVDRARRVLQCNAAARTLVTRNEGLTVSGETLSTNSVGASEPLSLALDAVFDGRGVTGGEVVILSRTDRRPLLAFISALRDPTSSELRAVVLVRDVAAQGEQAEDLLRRLFNLTAREARLATAIADGHTPESAAALLGMSVGTARTHLKRVFFKTATTRQAELVRLVLGEVPPVRAPNDGA